MFTITFSLVPRPIFLYENRREKGTYVKTVISEKNRPGDEAKINIMT